MSQPVDSTAVEIDEPVPAGNPPAPAGTELAHRQGSTELIHATSAKERVEIATEMATALDHVIKAQGMRTKVGQQKVVSSNGQETWVDKYHVNVEGWQTLATFLGLAVVPVWSRQVIDPATGQPERTTYTATVKRYHPQKQGGGLKEETTFDVDGYSWESRVEIYKDGSLVAAADAMCSRSEATWARRDDFALRGMAQTRATARAIAGAARWIVALAGYAGTPAEEMPQPSADVAAPPAPAELPRWAQAARPERRTELAERLVVLGDNDPNVLLGSIEQTVGHIPDVLVSFARALPTNAQPSPEEPSA